MATESDKQQATDLIGILRDFIGWSLREKTVSGSERDELEQITARATKLLIGKHEPSNTDLEQMKTIFAARGIEYTEGPRDVKDGPGTSIELEVGTKKVSGYSGFATYFYFDAQGNLDHVGIYE